MMINRRLTEAACLGILIFGGAFSGRAEITESVDVPLEWRMAGSTYKLGIWVGIAGGDRALFEFDTGGAGFYAAYDPTHPERSPWWGTDYTPSGNTVTNTYASGLQYTAEVVTAPVVLYGRDGTALIQAGTNTTVGQTTSIINTDNNTTEWPGPGHPTDGVFDGDFGLSLKDGESGLLNVLMQLDYAPNLTKGFVVHVGATNGTGDPSLRVGLTTNDIASFPILIDISGQKNDGGYKLTLFNSLMTLATGGTTNYSGAVGIALDTGNPTPGLHNTADGVASDLITTNSTNGDQWLTPDQLLTLTTIPSDGTNFNMFSFVTGTNYGENFVYVLDASGTNYYLNLGLPFFNQYDVMFDYEHGVVGLRPLPEASSSGMMLTALGGFWLLSLILSRRRKRRA